MLQIFILYLSTNLHPFHVSVTEFNVNERTGSLEIVMRVFIDDMENALNKYHDRSDIALQLSRTTPQNDSLIFQYITEHFSLKIDGQALDPTYIGSQGKNDVVICYFELEGINRFEEIVVTNTMLFSLFADQENIIHIEQNEQLRSLRLNRSNPAEGLRW